ncbi:MAG: hypothetical protein GY847_02330 [Proteobacteria bacterium]|nr:hypothetical protein [Pseudomonadota bacterium]
MPITFQHDGSRNLTVFTIVGETSFDDYKETLASHFDSDPTDYLLFDFTARGPIIKRLTNEQIAELAEFAKQNERPGKITKTALVVTTDVDFGLSRMYENLADLQDNLGEMGIFRSLEEAYDWLGIS